MWIILAFLAALGLYYVLGDYRQVEHYNTAQQKDAEAQQLLKHYHNTQEIIIAMEKAVAKNPEKAKGWYLLGRLYRAENNYPQATTAFAKAHTLKPHNFSYSFEYLQSLYVVEQQKHTPQIDQLMQQLEKNHPNNPALLDFLGYDAYNHHDYETAIRYWQQLLPHLEQDPKNRDAILLAIGKAQKKLQHS